MLFWRKRSGNGDSHEQLVENEHKTTSAEAKVERLVGRLGRNCNKMANEVARVSSQPRVIAVAAQKGGAGKTTIAAHLAVQASTAGHGPVVLADTDPQGSLSQWWRARNDDTLALPTHPLEDPPAHPAAVRHRR